MAVNARKRDAAAGSPESGGGGSPALPLDSAPGHHFVHERVQISHLKLAHQHTMTYCNHWHSRSPSGDVDETM
jgi:hypothetical protein